MGTARIGASVGAAVYPDHEDTIDALIKRADVCMYEAKKKGKNACVMETDGKTIRSGLYGDRK
jgi:diguanylate cyclase (GGDEF)-like protein